LGDGKIVVRGKWSDPDAVSASHHSCVRPVVAGNGRRPGWVLLDRDLARCFTKRCVMASVRCDTLLPGFLKPKEPANNVFPPATSCWTAWEPARYQDCTSLDLNLPTGRPGDQLVAISVHHGQVRGANPNPRATTAHLVYSSIRHFRCRERHAAPGSRSRALFRLFQHDYRRWARVCMILRASGVRRGRGQCELANIRSADGQVQPSGEFFTRAGLYLIRQKLINELFG
jgi:hypothetical protein